MRECFRVGVATGTALAIIYLLYHLLTVQRAVRVVPTPILHVLKEEYTVWPPFNARLPHKQVCIHIAVLPYCCYCIIVTNLRKGNVTTATLKKINV